MHESFLKVPKIETLPVDILSQELQPSCRNGRNLCGAAVLMGVKLLTKIFFEKLNLK